MYSQRHWLVKLHVGGISRVDADGGSTGFGGDEYVASKPVAGRQSDENGHRDRGLEMPFVSESAAQPMLPAQPLSAP